MHRSIRTWCQRLSLSVLLASAIAATSVFAHSNEYLDTVAGKHGGQLRMAGPWHFELVLDKQADGSKAMPVTVYLTDHGDQPIATQGAVSKVTIISQNKPVQVTLTTKAPNLLVGEAVYKAEPALKAVVQLTLNGESQNARFTPMANKPAKAESHQHDAAAGEHHQH
jgi:hypothetical protein